MERRDGLFHGGICRRGNYHGPRYPINARKPLGARMKEPTPEDMSYLSDQNIEWCCEHYFNELCKRDYDKAFRLWDRFGLQLDDTEPKTFVAVPHRTSA